MKVNNMMLKGLAIVLIAALSTGTVLAMASTDSVSVNAGAAKIMDAKTVSGNSISGNQTETKESDKKTESKAEESPAAVEQVKEAEQKQDEVKASTESGSIQWDKIVMANVQDSVNVRQEPSEEAEITGKLYKTSAGEMLEQKDGWTKVKSGNLVGWIKNDFLFFAKDAQEKAKERGIYTAVVTTETLRVRKEAAENAGVYGLLAIGEEVVVKEEADNWIGIQYDKNTIGYISKEFVERGYVLEEGESMEEITARAEEEQKQKEADKKASKASSEQSGRTTPTAVTNNGSIAATADDVSLLAALIQCEAGYEVYEGKVAVGSVVMNRLRSGRYGNSLYSVIFAKGQFGPAGSGKVANVLAKGPSASCIQAATDAINGVSMVGNATKFRNIRSGNAGIVIGNHVFW